MSELKPGLVIAGRYRIDALIGEGGMSTVWRGMDLTLSREVAVKILRDEIALQPESVSRFRREAHAAAKLNHPHVVQVYDTGVDGTIYYMVIEYLPEPDLKKIIKDWAPLPVAKVIDVAVQCCKALAYAHRNGIVHRDVKPHNILFTDDGRAKLSDFGIAAAVGAAGTGPGGFVLGSAHYMAPEQVQGSPAGPHSDLYSLGCVMYEALTGRTPFQGSSETDIASKHLRERPTPLRTLNPNVAPAVEFVVSKAMAREVSQRYRSAEEMLVDLSKLSGGQGLDRTGVFTAPEGATAVLQPPVAPRRELTPVAGARPDLAARAPGMSRPGPRSAEEGSEITPVLRPPVEARPNPWSALGAVVIAVLALIIVVWLARMAFYPEGNKKVQVPMVKGMSLAQARSALEANGLKVGQVSYESVPMGSEGTVIRQNPPEGQTVESGSAVDVVVNQGKELVIVVPVEGMSLTEANDTLERAKLKVGDVSQVYHATAPAGRVIKQAIKPATKVEAGTAIDLTVSKGPEPATITPPPAGAQGNLEPVEPDVTVVRDETFTPSDPSQRRFIVTVTVQGQQPGQSIQVVKTDDRGGPTVVMRGKLNPNQSQRVTVDTQGSATIEVIHEGKVVYRQDEQAPNLPSDTGRPAGTGPE